MKTCGRCKIEKTLDEFGKKRLNKDGVQLYQSFCKKCASQWVKDNYKVNKDYYLQKAKEQKERIDSFVKEYKASLKCSVCPEDDPCCLDFHHLNPEEKEISISNAINSGWSKDRILKEINKCIILCSNCHRKLHAGKLVAEGGFEPPTFSL